MQPIEMIPPRFVAQIPDELMQKWASIDPVTQCILKEQSIQRQQNEWIIRKQCEIANRLKDGDEAFDKVATEIEALKKLRDNLKSRWAVLAWIAGSLAIPISLLLIGAWLRSLFGHKV